MRLEKQSLKDQCQKSLGSKLPFKAEDQERPHLAAGRGRSKIDRRFDFFRSEKKDAWSLRDLRSGLRPQRVLMIQKIRKVKKNANGLATKGRCLAKHSLSEWKEWKIMVDLRSAPAFGQWRGRSWSSAL